ncbi:MAG: C1 family peptidase [Chloroflexota bacterium]
MNHKRMVLAIVVGLAIVMSFIPFCAEADSSEFPFYLGVIPSAPGDYPVADAPRRIKVQSLPSVIDLSADLPSVGSQGSQSSCVGWAVGYYYKSFQEKQERGWSLATQDHQFSPAFIYNQRATADCSADRGMSIPDAMSILVEEGALPLSEFPYNPQDSCTPPSEQQLLAALEYRASSYAAIFVGQGWADLAALKQHLAGGDPFIIAVPVYSSFLCTCDDPLIREPGGDETWYGAHALLVVGYDDAVGGFKFVNSWGGSYGCEGFGYLSYGFVQSYAYEAWKMYDEVAPSNAPPSICFVAPSSGASDPGQWVPFTATYSDQNGWEDVEEAFFMVGDGQPAHSAYLKYSRSGNLVWLRSDDDTSWLGGHALGSALTIENGRAAVDMASCSVDGVGDTLTLRCNIRFGEGFLGSHTLLAMAEDSAGLSSGWGEAGSWFVGQAAEVPLAQGWNLISLPVVPASTSISDVLASIEGYYDAVQVYAGYNGQEQWSSYCVGVPTYANTLQQVDETMGLWVSVTEPVTLRVVGSRPNGVEIPLYAGWNMVGYPTEICKSIPDALLGIGEKLTMVRWYNPFDAKDPWKHYDPSAPSWANDLVEMQSGRGYWIQVSEDCVWVVDTE